MVYTHVKEGTDWSAGLEEDVFEEMMADRGEGYAAEMCGVGGKITACKGGCLRWRIERR